MSARTNALAAELLALQNENGLIVPREVVTWARRHRSSRLYGELEWDDSVAGAAYREQQVRQLIAIHVIEDHSVRRFISLSVDRVQGGGYRDMNDVMTAPNLRDVMLQDALSELERMQRKYQRLKELEGVWDAAATVRRRRPPRKRAA